MNLVEELYFGWVDLAHGQDCPLPVWEPQLAIEQGRRGRRLPAEPGHACSHPECDHATVFARFTVRLVCQSCDVVHLITGEGAGRGTTTTAAYGFGQPAREVAGLWLWPSGLHTPGNDAEPSTFLVTLTPNRPSRPVHVAGRIAEYFERRRRFNAAAIVEPAGKHTRTDIEFRRRRTNFRSLDAAAEWIADQHRPQHIEVAV
ncbi:hypothetical protein ACWDO7_23030 [Streptomyces sp. NPDC003656]